MDRKHSYLSALLLIGLSLPQAYAVCMDPNFCAAGMQAAENQVPAMANILWALPIFDGPASVPTQLSDLNYAAKVPGTGGQNATFLLTENSPAGQDTYSVVLPMMGVFNLVFTNSRQSCVGTFVPASPNFPDVPSVDCSGLQLPLKNSSFISVFNTAIQGQTYGADTKGIISAFTNGFSVQSGNFWGYWQHSCGGSLIDATHILTAAHCVTDPTDFSIRPPAGLGVSIGSTWGATATIYSVANIARDPDFQAYTDRDHDFAILTLATAVPASTVSNYFKLGTGTQNTATAAKTYGALANSFLYVSGFGATEPEGQPGDLTLPATLNYGSQQYIDTQTCQNMLQAAGISPSQITAITLCAGTYQPLGAGDTPMAATCPGDSGSPFFVVVDDNATPQAPGDWGRADNTYVQLGVDSFTGVGCVSIPGPIYPDITPSVRANVGSLCDNTTNDGQWFLQALGIKDASAYCYAWPSQE